MKIRSGLACVLATVVNASGLHAQTLMTSNDLTTLTAPPPDHRLPYGRDPLQFGNLRLPSGNGPFPIVVLIHGGCWLSGFDVAHLAALEQAIADSGIAVWSIEYRRVGNDGGGWPSTFTDIGKAADFLREIAPKYNLDLNRVVAAGHSAGGQFALWLSARKKIPQSSELFIQNPLPIRAVFGLAPAPDLEALHAAGTCGNVINRLMGGSPAAHADRYAAASPMQLAPVGVPQVHVLGAHDRTWTPIGRAYVQRARELGDTSITVIDAPDAGHFELIAPASSTWPIVIRELKALVATISR